MVLSYDYSNRNRRRRGTNAPPSKAISMDIAVRRWDTERIAWWRWSRAFIKATKLCHRATTCSVSPRRPPGRQSTQQWAKCPPPLLVILMAVAMRRYNTARITRWGRGTWFWILAWQVWKASSSWWDQPVHQWQTPCMVWLVCTIGRAIAPIASKGTLQRRLFRLFHCEKGLQLTCWPPITIGVWHIKLMWST